LRNYGEGGMMENKAKFFIIGLIGILLISIVFGLQIYNAKTNLENEKQRLLTENSALTQKAEESQRNARRLEEKSNTLSKELDKVNKDKEDFQKRIDLLTREKEELIDRLKTQKQTIVALPEQNPPAQPVVGDAYWAGILKAKTDLGMQVGDLRDALKSAQINNEQLQRDKGSLQLDINGLKRDRDDLKRQVDYNQKLVDSIAQDLVREKNDKVKIQENLKSLKSENAVLTRQLKSLNSRRSVLERKLQDLQEAKGSIENKFSEMQNMLSQKVSQVNELKEQLESIRSGTLKEETAVPMKKESVELPPIVVRPQPEPEVKVQEGTTVLGGKVLAINKDSNFVIIDLGEDAGVKIGDAFQVYRDDKPVGAIEVIQTRKNISACDIKKEATPIKIGDIVR